MGYSAFKVHVKGFLSSSVTIRNSED